MLLVLYLVVLWTLVLTQTEFVLGGTAFIERQQGESVVLTCVASQRTSSPFGVYLRRSWLDPGEVLFMYTKSPFKIHNNSYRDRVSISGDPSSHSVNVTISELRPGDTERYHCEFMVNNEASEDIRIPGETDFLLLVSPDASLVDMQLVETCSGGAAVLPCLPPHGSGLAVEGVSLKRKRGGGPVEVLYHSQQHGGSSTSLFPADRFHLSSAPGPGGLVYNLTLQQLQPGDSGLYSCQLLLQGRAHSSGGLGRRVFFVSVQGDECGCFSYSVLLYALSAAVVVLVLLLTAVSVVIYKGNTHRSDNKSQSQAPIYEEMSGIQPLNRKLAPRHLEDLDSSEYRNCPGKKPCPENHYESPRSDSQK